MECWFLHVKFPALAGKRTYVPYQTHGNYCSTVRFSGDGAAWLRQQDMTKTPVSTKKCKRSQPVNLLGTNLCFSMVFVQSCIMWENVGLGTVSVRSFRKPVGYWFLHVKFPAWAGKRTYVPYQTHGNYCSAVRFRRDGAAWPRQQKLTKRAVSTKQSKTSQHVNLLGTKYLSFYSLCTILYARVGQCWSWYCLCMVILEIGGRLASSYQKRSTRRRFLSGLDIQVNAELRQQTSITSALCGLSCGRLLTWTNKSPTNFQNDSTQTIPRPTFTQIIVQDPTKTIERQMDYMTMNFEFSSWRFTNGFFHLSSFGR